MDFMLRGVEKCIPSGGKYIFKRKKFIVSE